MELQIKVAMILEKDMIVYNILSVYEMLPTIYLYIVLPVWRGASREDEVCIRSILLWTERVCVIL